MKHPMLAAGAAVALVVDDNVLQLSGTSGFLFRGAARTVLWGALASNLTGWARYALIGAAVIDGGMTLMNVAALASLRSA